MISLVTYTKVSLNIFLKRVPYPISFQLRSHFYDILRCSVDLNCHNVIYEIVMYFNIGGTCDYHIYDSLICNAYFLDEERQCISYL
jgi:hypothetical protein